MGICRVQVVIPRDTGLPEDVSTNTFHFITPNADVEQADVDAIDTLILEYYTTAPGGDSSLWSWYGVVNGTTVSRRYYDLSDPTPRVPIDINSSDFGATGGDSLPEECAAVNSFEGAPSSGVNQSRRRGRLYHGPLRAGAVAISSNRVLLVPGVLNTLNSISARLKDNSITATRPWAVFSPTNGTAVQVHRGWADNAVDTQRRRGPAGSVRQTWVT